jgi:hypothetical protein
MKLVQVLWVELSLFLWYSREQKRNFDCLRGDLTFVILVSGRATIVLRGCELSELLTLVRGPSSSRTMALRCRPTHFKSGFFEL